MGINIHTQHHKRAQPPNHPTTNEFTQRTRDVLRERKGDGAAEAREPNHHLHFEGDLAAPAQIG